MTYFYVNVVEYAAFDRPNKTNVMIITPREICYQDDLKISKANVKTTVAEQR